MTTSMDSTEVPESSGLVRKERLRDLADDIAFRIWAAKMGTPEDDARALDPVEFGEAALTVFFDSLPKGPGDELNPENQERLLAFRYGILVGRGAYGDEGAEEQKDA